MQAGVQQIVAGSMAELLEAKFNGSTWSYQRGGHGPPLLWLHGLWGEPGWEAHHQRLAERYTVYAPILAGYHGSSAPDWLTDMEDLSTLLVDFLQALQLDRPHVIGHSLGGWAAAELAVFRPSLIRSLVLIDPLGIALDWTRMPNLFYHNPVTLPACFFADPSLEAAHRYIPPPVEWDERFITNRAASARLAFEPYLHSRKLGVRLRFANVAALIVWGERDSLVSVDHAEVWRKSLPDAWVAIVKDAGHLPHIERREECLPILLEFLARVPHPQELAR
jgi:pimeloyl-ACP methyl ester carboxylesterase